MGLDVAGLGSIFDFGSKVIDKIFPDKDAAAKAKLEFMKLQQDGQLEELKLEYENMAQQAAINLEEAKSASMWVAGWRPFIGWVCGTGFLYAMIVRPLLVTAGADAPEIDMSVMSTVLLAMLGVGGMRSFDKAKGTDTKQIGAKK
jgi:hypothetical protein